MPIIMTIDESVGPLRPDRIKKKKKGKVKKAQFGGMISPRPGRATVDSMRALGRNPQRTLSPRDDMRVANYLTRNIRPQPFNVEDASVQDYVRFNDGGMASKTKVY
jgi:predicted Zn-dependent protease